jgi:hypothetical protein
MTGIRGDQAWGPTLTLSTSDVGSRDGVLSPATHAQCKSSTVFLAGDDAGAVRWKAGHRLRAFACTPDVSPVCVRERLGLGRKGMIDVTRKARM